MVEGRVQRRVSFLLRSATPSWLAAALVLAASARDARCDVIVNEIFYNPPEGSALEFIELHNTLPQAAAIAGWSFTEGVAFEFPEGTVIEGNGFLLVAQNRDEVIRRFGLPEGAVLGNYTGSLDNGGERLTLSDLDGVIVESFRYDDQPPWDADADGGGASLERVCTSFDAEHPANWSSERASEPTPLLPSRLVQCPPPSLPPPRIAINEIHYHPLGDKDLTDEFIELKNNSTEAVNLKDYAFTSGVTFTFLEDTVLAPGALLVVARDKEHLKTAFGVTNVVGNFEGQLSNDGERVTLVDPPGAYVDSVRYYDKGDWPVAADGLGYSLEKVLSTATSDDPASWKEAGLGDLTQWRSGKATGISTSSRILLTLDGEGEFIIDNVKLIDPANPGVNFIPNATFDAGIESWVAKGNHADSIWDPAGGPDGSGALRIVSRGRGTGATNGIALETVPDLVRVGGPTYELTFDYRYVTGVTGLFLRLSGATVNRGIYFKLGEGPVFSPGAANTSASEHIPPYVSRVTRLSREPGSGEPVTITARARAEGELRSLKLLYKVNATGDSLPVDLADDGAHEDGLAGDGVYGGTIPALPHNTIVIFTLEAVDAAGAVTTSPPRSDPTGVHGYYVNDEKPDSPFPTYTLLMNHTAATPPRTILRALDCVTWRPASLAWRGDLYYNIGLRRRGGSVCGDPNVIKPYLKARFQRGRELEGLRKLNFQSLWTDKSLVREKMAWEMFRDVGMPDCFEYYVRLHANGQYFGLYGALEHPDQRFLTRNRLNPDGNLYKATASREEINGTYEKKTNENGDMTDLREFLTALNTTPSPQLKAFFTDNVDADRVIDYQLVQTLTNNADYPHKNHYLYHDLERGRWMPLSWDMDLTFGKLWDGGFGGVLHDRMHNPGNTPWYTTNVDGAGGGNVLLDRFFSLAGDWFRRAYIVRLHDALLEKYTEEFFAEKIEGLREIMLDEQAEDIAVWGRSPATADDRTAPKEFDPNLLRVKEHIRLRRTFLLNYLKTRSKFTGHDRLKVTEVMYNPRGGGEDLEFLELWNPGETEINLTGWTIEGIDFAFPADYMLPAGGILVVAKSPSAFKAEYGSEMRVLGPYEGNLDNDGEILRVKDAGPGYPATVDFLRYGKDGEWPRGGDGLGYSIELSGASATRDNDMGLNWRQSFASGGSPGTIQGLSPGSPMFRRGDPNADSRLNVSDAIAILRHLFAGAGELACMESADIDANGEVQSVDALLILSYLFQGRGVAVEIPSPGPSECLPAKPDLCKESNCSG